MKTSILLLLSAFWLGSAFASGADEDPVAPQEVPLSLELEPFDVDGNGRLSVEERQAYEDALKEAAKAQWRINSLLWDRDGNGILSDEERDAAYAAIKQKIEAERIARFDELDKNEDDKLSPAEFLGVPALKPSLVKRILDHVDTDRDGFISKAEFLAALDAAPVKNAAEAQSAEPNPIYAPPLRLPVAVSDPAQPKTVVPVSPPLPSTIPAVPAAAPAPAAGMAPAPVVKPIKPE